jgi:hypothetical protein
MHTIEKKPSAFCNSAYCAELETENTRLLAALNDIANMVQPPDGYYAQERAREALEK